MDLSMMTPPELEELTTCSLCHLPFNDTDAVPKLFTCRHYFCLKCVNLLQREGSDEIVCTNCWNRTKIQGPEPKIENLPNHMGILYLIQNFNALNMGGSKTENNNANVNRNEERTMSDTNFLTNNFANLNGDAHMMINNFNGGATNSQNVCILDMSKMERSPSITSSSGGSMASGITLGGIVGYNGDGNGSSNNNNNNNNNCGNRYTATSSSSNTNNNTNNATASGGSGAIACTLQIGENCMTHAMPKTLWCSTCGIQLCRACAGTEEHRMHPVRNQIEAKESLQNDISSELQTMHKTLNDVQQLLMKQRDFLVKILESCTTLKSQIESELLNPIPTAEIAEMRETLAKASLCMELVEKQTPGDALKLYTTLHSEKQRLVAKYQEMFLQCKLDELIKNCGYVFDFDLIKQALIQFHNHAVNGGGGLEVLMLNGFNQTHQNPILLLTNYCISQLYSRHMLVLKQQQQQQQVHHQQQQQQHQQQQMQHHQGINITNQISQQQQQQQVLNSNKHFNQHTEPQQQQQQQQQHQHHYMNQQFQQQPTILPNGFLNSLISNLSSNNNSNNNNNNNVRSNETSAQQTTYAQALQQSISKAQQQQQQQQSPIGERSETSISKSYASIINNANKQAQQTRHQQQHHQHQHQQLQKQQSQMMSKLIPSNEFPVLAPIGTRSSSSSSNTSSTLSVQRTTTHIFATKATTSATRNNDLNGLNMSMLHLQHQSVRAQANRANHKQQQQQHLQHQSKPSQLVLDPNIHIYPIYYFNIEIEGEPLGRFLIEVRHDVAPKMAKNFNSLVTHEFGIGYKGCQVFQCWDNESIITGDYELNNGRGGRSVLEEAFFLPEDTKILGIRGSVGMRRSQKRHDNMGLVGSQFRIILREMRGFTGIFGFVIDNLELVERISKVGDPTGKPQSIVTIASCGKY